MSGDKIRVLIVDDSLDVQMILGKLLFLFAPEVEVVASVGNGAEGIRQTREHQPDIVLMDVNLPDIDGVTATRVITQEAPLSKVIMMSAQEEPEYIRRSRSAGASRLLLKPIDSDELVATIRSVYRRRNGPG